MSFVNKLLSIPNYYLTINPSTLSGSCDIIVVKNANNVLSCTNFHIRFGKKQIFRLKECNITMFVNNVHCPLNLKLGKQGEVLFEKEVEERKVRKCSYESVARIVARYNLDVSVRVESRKGMVRKMENEVERVLDGGMGKWLEKDVGMMPYASSFGSKEDVNCPDGKCNNENCKNCEDNNNDNIINVNIEKNDGINIEKSNDKNIEKSINKNIEKSINKNIEKSEDMNINHCEENNEVTSDDNNIAESEDQYVKKGDFHKAKINYDNKNVNEDNFMQQGEDHNELKGGKNIDSIDNLTSATFEFENIPVVTTKYESSSFTNECIKDEALSLEPDSYNTNQNDINDLTNFEQQLDCLNTQNLESNISSLKLDISIDNQSLNTNDLKSASNNILEKNKLFTSEDIKIKSQSIEINSESTKPKSATIQQSTKNNQQVSASVYPLNTKPSNANLTYTKSINSRELLQSESKTLGMSFESHDFVSDIDTSQVKKSRVRRTVQEKEKIMYIRFKNRERRMFFIRHKQFNYAESSAQHKSFFNIFKSTEHCDFITKTHEKLYTLLVGLINPNIKINKDIKCCDNKNCCLKACRTNESTGCSGSQLSFSLCLKTRIENGKFKETFENFRCRSIENLNNLVVRIEGCKSCNVEYFLPYEIFTEFFFYLRTLIFSENTGSNRKFNTYVHKRLLECYNYNAVKKEVHEYGITLSDNQLKKLKLQDGQNKLLFKIDGTSQQLSADCFLWNEDVRLIVSDIDGTITKSDAWGHVYTMIGKDWTHNGVAELFTKIHRNSYQIIYLSSRPLGQINYTKNYLFNISQRGYKLPVGPVLLSPNGLFGAIFREMILRNPQEFKIACLLDIRKLFKHNPFVSGFGNRKTDIITYYTLGIPKGKMFIIDPKGRICENSVEKRNYETLNALVENVFPPINMSCHVNHDVQWWIPHSQQ